MMADDCNNRLNERREVEVLRKMKVDRRKGGSDVPVALIRLQSALLVHYSSELCTVQVPRSECICLLISTA